jgi:hypothetical protein
MNRGTIFGLILLIGGVAIWALYGLSIGFDAIMNALNFWTGLVGGLIIIGIIVIFVSVVIDRYHGYHEMKEKIKEEDLEP